MKRYAYRYAYLNEKNWKKVNVYPKVYPKFFPFLEELTLINGYGGCRGEKGTDLFFFFVGACCPYLPRFGEGRLECRVTRRLRMATT